MSNRRRKGDPVILKGIWQRLGEKLKMDADALDKWRSSFNMWTETDWTAAISEVWTCRTENYRKRVISEVTDESEYEADPPNPTEIVDLTETEERFTKLEKENETLKNQVADLKQLVESLVKERAAAPVIPEIIITSPLRELEPEITLPPTPPVHHESSEEESSPEPAPKKLKPSMGALLTRLGQNPQLNRPTKSKATVFKVVFNNK